MDPVVILHHALPAATPDAVPEWVHLVPAGSFRGMDGRGPYTLEDPAAVIHASMLAGELTLDENHSTDLAAPRGEPAPARGWIVEMQARADGLWGRVNWTAAGRAMIADRSYRGISPAIRAAKVGGRVLSVLRASLTNNPNLTQLATLHHQQEPAVDLNALRAALGLAETADEAAILAAAGAARTAVTAHAAQIARIAEAARVENPTQAGADAIVTALQSVNAGDVGQLRATVLDLQTRLNAEEQRNAQDRAVAVVDAAIREGKPIQALREDYIARHAANPEQVEKELSKLPSLHSGGVTGRTAGGGNGGTGADGLSADERQIIALMGVDPEAFKKAAAAANQEVV